MVVEAQRLPVEALARAAERIAAGGDFRDALEQVAAAAAEATGADVAVVRVVNASGALVARAAAPAGSALAAEIAGSRIAPDEIAAGEPPSSTLDAARRARAAGVLAVPALAGGRIVGSLELLRASAPFDEAERALAELAAAQIALAARTLAAGGSTGTEERVRALELAGEALAAGADMRRAAQQTIRVAADAALAAGGAIWRVGAGEERDVELLAQNGTVLDSLLDRAEAHAREALAAREPVSIALDPSLPDGSSSIASVLLGQPPFAVLQLLFAEEPSERELAALAGFAGRAAHALRAGERARDVESELERTRALLSVVGEAISRLSLAHTLETAVERIAELLGIEQVGVYLREHGRLFAAAGRGLTGGHEDVAHRLLDLALGPLRARGAILVRIDAYDPALTAARVALAEAGLEAALAVPLNAGEDPIGLLVAYPGNKQFAETELALLSSLAAQLAVAVQNARLHEQAKELGDALEATLSSERQAGRQLGALYEISRSFAQSLSLETTLEAVTTTIVEVLGVDAAVVRVPAERGDQLVPRAVHVADVRLAGAVRTILDRPQPGGVRVTRAMLLDVGTAARLGDAHALLVPFLEKGSTAAVLPIATPSEVLAQLTILSLDPAAPISEETLATAETIAAQAALAIDNARLYQQQKAFAETIQRALLPRDEPDVPGLELGAVYESAARVDVGGDVYDFMKLPDGRLAVVLGDVTGHGIEATADMAMAKFVFRSLAREHPDPGDFLSHANEVVVGEIAVGKFITMAYLTIDPGGRLAAAGAGHPAPRLVLPDGTVESLACSGLALGIEASQTYDEVHAEVPPGAAVVLYTDGVIEARTGHELYGMERLDAALAARRDLPARELAQAVLEECRTFAGGELGDDCAIVVVKRTP